MAPLRYHQGRGYCETLIAHDRGAPAPRFSCAQSDIKYDALPSRHTLVDLHRLHTRSPAHSLTKGLWHIRHRLCFCSYSRSGFSLCFDRILILP